MLVRVLGAAAGGGFPQWNCACPGCRLAREQPALAHPRHQTCVAVSEDGKAWFLLNAPPDLRQQIMAAPELAPRGSARHSPIAGVLLTGGDVDQVGGLLVLREGHPFTIYASAGALGLLAVNPIFGVLDAELVRRIPLDGPEMPLRTGDGTPSGLSVRPVALDGKVPLWMEGRAEAAAAPIGLILRDAAGRRLAFLPSCRDVTDELREAVADADLLLFDGTLWHDEELIATGTGWKTGRRMGHISVSGPQGALAAWADVPVGRKVFIHLNNTNPLLLENSPERQVAAEHGWSVARDGDEHRL